MLTYTCPDLHICARGTNTNILHVHNAHMAIGFKYGPFKANRVIVLCAATLYIYYITIKLRYSVKLSHKIHYCIASIGTIQRFTHAQLVLQISIPVPSCTGTLVPHSHCVLGLPQHVQRGCSSSTTANSTGRSPRSCQIPTW